MPRVPWSTQDDQRFKEGYEIGGMPAVRALFRDRTEDSLAARAKRLRVHHPVNGWSEQDVARLRAAFGEGGLPLARAVLTHRSNHAIRDKLVALRLIVPKDPDPACIKTIGDALIKHGGNLTQAARALGIHRSSLRRKAIQFGLVETSTKDAWSTREVQVLRQHYERLTIDALKPLLPGRTKLAIRSQWRRMSQPDQRVSRVGAAHSPLSSLLTA